MERPTFAEWQWNRGIVPWTFKHPGAEVRYRHYAMRNQLGAVQRSIIDSLAPVLSDMCRVVLQAVDAFKRLAP